MTEPTDVDTSTEVETSPLGLSDAAFMELPMEPAADVVVVEPEVVMDEDPVSTDVDPVVDDETDEESTISPEDPDVVTAVDAATADDVDADVVDVDKAASDVVDTEVDDPTAAATQLAELFAPFRANGKDMQVGNIEEARTLMQMGANYNKKMAAIKPNLRVIKMLENNNLLDEGKLSYLIDLDKKDPKAIKKLIQDSKVDPDTLELDVKTDYAPNTYTVSDNEMNLDGILDEIQGTESFGTTMDIIGNKWDTSSKKVLVEQPEIIKHINDHVASGIYSQIEQEVSRQRMLNGLSGLSDLEAYKQVGDKMSEAGAFTSSTAQTTTTPAKVSIPKSSNSVDPKLRNRKKAASATTAKPTGKPDPSTINVLGMSDEEFAKVGNDKFI